jgi:hypothetical protein
MIERKNRLHIAFKNRDLLAVMWGRPSGLLTRADLQG